MALISPNSFLSFIEKYRYYFIIAFLVTIIVIAFLVPVITYYMTQFEKVITIKDKYTRYRRRGSNYNIVDANGHIYQVDNLWFKGDFNRSNDYVALAVGGTYRVKGYGYRFGMMDSYQKIYAFEEV
jgi:hypothetical protein